MPTPTAIDLHGQGKPLTLRNADVANDAAIAYSKLALTGAIVNADIVSLAYSKLTGAPTIPTGYWSPLTNGNGAAPDLIYDFFGDVIMGYRP